MLKNVDTGITAGTIQTQRCSKEQMKSCNILTCMTVVRALVIDAAANTTDSLCVYAAKLRSRTHRNSILIVSKRTLEARLYRRKP